MKTRGIAGGVLIGLAALVYWQFFPSDERRIRGRLDDLAETLTDDGAEGLAQVARIARLARYVTTDVTVDLGPTLNEQLQGRDMLVAAAGRVQQTARTVVVEFVDVQVSVTPERGEASTYLTGKASGIDERGETVTDARELEMSWRLVDGEWLIASVRAVETPDRPR